MIWRVIAVGKLKDPNLKAAVADYGRRIQRYVRFEMIELKPLADAEITDAMLKQQKPGDILIALDERGKGMSSNDLAKRLDRWALEGKKGIAFVIGGADGLTESVIRKSDLRLSLSPMTLPHQLARLVLVEQLYRACTILKGEPYPR